MFLYRRSRLSTAIVLATLTAASLTVEAAYDPDVIWNSADVPSVSSDPIEFAGKDLTGHWAGVLVENGASGSLNNIKLDVSAIGPKDGSSQDNQIYGIEVLGGTNPTFGGDSMHVSIETDFIGGGNNQATAFDAYTDSDVTLSADLVDFSVTSKSQNGKSVYGLGKGKSGTLFVTGEALNINLSTATDRQNSAADNSYSEAIGIDIYGGVLDIAEQTKVNITVHSSASTIADSEKFENGASPATGIKFEKGQGVIRGDVTLDVSSNGGLANGIWVTNYFYNTSLGENFNDAAATLGNVKATVSSTANEAYGIVATYNPKEGEQNTVILQANGTTDLDVTTETGSAVGIGVYGNTTVEMNGNVNATATATKDGGTAYSLYADEGTMTLAGPANHLTGDVVVNNAGTLELGSTAHASETTLTGNLTADASSTVKATNQTIRLGLDNTMNVAGTFAGENATVIYDTDVEGGVTIANNTASKARILASSRLTDLYDTPQELVEKGVVNVKNGTEGITQGGEAGTVAGAWTIDADGNVTQEANYSMAALQQFNASTFVQWRNEVNHLSQRLGDVRGNLRTAGAWARVYGGESNVKQDVTTDIRSTTIQVGADATVSGNWIVGGAFSYTNMDADISNGSGESDGYTLAAYASGFFDCGGYVDVIGRIGRLSTDITASNLSSAAMFDGSYDNTAFGLSAEVGYHWALSQTFWLEPQVELAYGYVLGDDFTASNDVKVEQDDMQTLMGRLGARLGASFPKNAGEFYVHASVNHEFLGDNDFDATPAAGRTRSFSNDLDGTWVSYGVGMQLNATEQFAFYGTLERSHGDDYNDSYRYSIGGRYVW